MLTASRLGLAADSVIDLAVEHPGAVINPSIYGHFIEHLGGVIYDGLWVGRESKIPNVDGLRKQFVDDMKRLGAPVLRWPGGCFADGYHWRDGIGPPASRPRTYNFWESRMPPGLHATETNQFGVHEFMHLCRLVGAEPYLAANVGSGTPREFHDWVSYCNAPSGTERLAAERAANGDAAPFGVKYWGVGNESWGCGGDMKPGEYAEQYRRFVTQFPAVRRAVPDRDRPARSFTRHGPGLDHRVLRGDAAESQPAAGVLAALLHGLPQQPDAGRRLHRSGMVRGPSGRAARRSRSSRLTGPRWRSTTPSTTRGWWLTSGASGTSRARRSRPATS